MENTNQIVKLPAIICDVDGVLHRGKEKLACATEAIQIINSELKKINPIKFANINSTIPFVCVTNGGGNIESVHINKINKMLNLIDCPEQIKKEQMICNFTPLRPIMKNYQDKIILIGGFLNVTQISEDCGCKKYITIEEYCTLFPYLIPLENRSQDNAIKLWPIIKERLQIENDEIFNKPIQVSAIFLLNDPSKWEICIQIICDLCTTDNGQISTQYPLKDFQKHIPIYCVNDDLVYQSEFPLPRIVFGGFTASLKNCYKLMHGRELEIQHFGKPYKTTFQYVQQHLQEVYKNVEISKYYMIGDNPNSDIKGGNDMGWETILVKTGVWNKNENSTENPAKYFLNDILEAVKLILSKEGILEQ